MHLSSTSARRSLWARIIGFFRRHNSDDDDLIFLNRRQVHQLLDERARRDLGLSADEFLSAFDRGELRDSPLAQHLMLIAGERAHTQSERSTQTV